MAERGVVDLPDQDLAIVRQILDQYIPDRPVFVFGSRATGRARRRSDLDIAVGGGEPITRRLQGELDEAFDESDLPIEVDIIDVPTVSEIFRQRMMSEWIELSPARRTPAAPIAPEQKGAHA